MFPSEEPAPAPRRASSRRAPAPPRPARFTRRLGVVGALVAAGVVLIRLVAGSEVAPSFAIKAADPSESALVVIGSRARVSPTGEFWYVDGEVKNTSVRRLTNVQVVASWFDDAGNRVGVDGGPLELQWIQPGETSTFHAVSRRRPRMSRYSLQFLSGTGSPVSARTALVDVPLPSDASRSTR